MGCDVVAFFSRAARTFRRVLASAGVEAAIRTNTADRWHSAAKQRLPGPSSARAPGLRARGAFPMIQRTALSSGDSLVWPTFNNLRLAPRRRAAFRRPASRPRLEALEDRTVPSTLSVADATVREGPCPLWGCPGPRHAANCPEPRTPPHVRFLDNMPNSPTTTTCS